jgi:hypothetical protein
MNTAFRKGKLSKWYGSRFYKSILGPSLNYSKWLSMQPKHIIEGIYGKGCIIDGEIVPI